MGRAWVSVGSLLFLGLGCGGCPESGLDPSAGPLWAASNRSNESALPVIEIEPARVLKRPSWRLIELPALAAREASASWDFSLLDLDGCEPGYTLLPAENGAWLDGQARWRDPADPRQAGYLRAVPVPGAILD